MEYKVRVLGQDTREKMQIRHIKGLGIVEKLGNDNPGSNEFYDQDDETTIEQIKKDLEDVDDVFAANAFSAGFG